MSADHSGHRQRLKRSLKENGLTAFSPHEVIELMLYTALPRRDVNELAHRIDDRFGGVCGLMNADEKELTAMGLSPGTAGTLKAYADCVKAYTASFEESREERGAYVLNRGDLDRLIGDLYRPGKRMLALLSTAQEILFTSEIPQGNPARFIAEKALIYDASAAVAVCGRESGMSDRETEQIREKLKLIDVRFDQYMQDEG